MIGLIGFIIYFILGAINWILSKGDKMKLENARNQIMHAFIGVIILISVYAVIKLIEIAFGLDILNLDFGSLIIQ